MYKGSRARGFTLIELLVVIAIIALLSGVILATLVSARQRSRDGQRIANARQLTIALAQYEIANNTFRVANAGYQNTGGGLVSKIDGTNYTNSIVAALKSGGHYTSDKLKDPLYGDDNYYLGMCASTSAYYLYLKVEQAVLQQSSTTIQAGCDGAAASTLGFNYIAAQIGGGTTTVTTTSGYVASAVYTKLGVLPTARAGLACAPANSGLMYCFGGDQGSANIITQIVSYNPTTDTVAIKSATLPGDRAYFACAPNPSTGKIYCFGGINTAWATRYNQILEYDPSSDTIITKSATLPTLRHALSCATNPLTNKIYCFGGYDLSSGYLSQITEYDPATNVLATKSAILPTARYYTSCAGSSTTGKIYCFGGHGTAGYFADVVEYNPSTDTIVTKSAVLPTVRRGMSCVDNPSTDRIYCFGGYDGTNQIADILEYNVALGTITTLSATPLPQGLSAESCALNPNTNKSYCLGGGNAVGAIAKIYEF